MDFPSSISFTITNRCNLACRMCGQWSAEGYMLSRKKELDSEMTLADWIRLVDEAAENKPGHILLRGGEPFLFPGIIGLMEHIVAKKIPLSIDTNGTMLGKYAEDLVGLENLHLTISVDGTEAVHDEVRNIKGCFRRIRENLALLREVENREGRKISKSANFTISPWSLPGLGDLPDTVRGLGLDSLAIVPYYYFPLSVGERYEAELKELGGRAFSWRGFHHEKSGIGAEDFLREFRKFNENLKGVYNYPYMPLTEQQYLDWFNDPSRPVGSARCTNVEQLIDIQPSGDANFCVDFIDFTIGNVRHSTISDVWNSAEAERFREYRRKKPLAVCYRCGAKYMSCSFAGYSAD